MPLGRKMRQRVEQAAAVVEAALQQQRGHVSLTDPDAQMMQEGRDRKIRECHSFEVAVDNAHGLLVAGQRSGHGPDNQRLEPLVEAAQAQEPQGVQAVDGDSGYYSGDAVARLLARGIDTCIPDSNTAGDLHRGLPVGSTRQRHRQNIAFIYDEARDSYTCPEGKVLQYLQTRQHGGQQVKVYRAQTSCAGCVLASACLQQPRAKWRMLKVSTPREHHQLLEAARQRFDEPAHRERYRHRGEVVETVFGFLRGTLGYARWMLRGSLGVGCEARLFKVVYQLRKVHLCWAQMGGGTVLQELNSYG